MEPWWDRHPGVLEREKTALDGWGQPWKLDEAQFAAGRLVVRIGATVRGEVRELVALYPDSYPYFMPQVQLREIQLPKHHNREGNLCLLANDGADWIPDQDTLVTLLREQLPKLEAVTDTDADPDFVAQNEDRVGEPLSNFLPYMERSAILVPDALPDAKIVRGELRLLARPNVLGFLAQLRQVLAENGKVDVDFPTRPASFKEQVQGFWARLQHRPNVDGLNEDQTRTQLYNLAKDSLPAFQKRLRIARTGETFVLGLLYPDEVRWREAAEDWIFLWARVTEGAKGGRNPAPPAVQYGLVRADWAGEKAMLMRAPFLAPLRSKSVLVVGIGAIGSPLALQLAKSGIAELTLLDMDHVQAGNSVRWALGSGLAGLPKLEVISSHIANEYPRTKVTQISMRIGGQAHGPDGKPISDYDLLRTEIARSDLLIDGTANFRVNHLLADLARREKKSYLWLSTTPGCAGGVVGRVVPERSAGCWHCFQHGLRTGSYVLPADKGSEDVQPQGCTHATFVGAGVDSDEVPLLAARLAIATLLAQDGNDVNMAADFEWDVGIGDFFNGERRIAPSWTTYELTVHPDCAMCCHV